MGMERGGLGTSPLYFAQRCQVRESEEGRVKPPQPQIIGVFKVRGCSTNEAKKGEIDQMFLRRRFDVCALSETKLKGKGARESLVFLSAYGSGSEKNEKIVEFWNELCECVGSFGRNESVVVLGDLNAKVGNEVIEGIVGRHGVPGRNESGERLQEMCAEQELVVGNSGFKKNYVYKYTWVRMAKGRVVDKALMDYVLLP